MQLTQAQQQPTVDQSTAGATAEVTVYSHSALFYWWPVWTLGLALASLTYFHGVKTPFDDAAVVIHPSKNLGVLFAVVVLLVILMTNVYVRGIASLTVIVSLLALTFLFAYMHWWDRIFRIIDSLAIYLNLGFYVFFSLAVFGLWALAFLVFDRFNYWIFRPGQLIHHSVFGSGEQSYDTEGMSVNKLRDDLFRHWILGLGSGDLHIATTGAVRQEFVVPNVLFVGGKLKEIQRLVAMKPDEAAANVVTVGEPQ